MIRLVSRGVRSRVFERKELLRLLGRKGKDPLVLTINEKRKIQGKPERIYSEEMDE
jgi:hypothetical protein